MSDKTVDVSGLADHRANVAKIIQQTFFPSPQFHWNAMSPEQRGEFLDCADEIFAYLHGWNHGKAPQPRADND